MPNPTTAAEWAEHCRLMGHVMCFDSDSHRVTRAMCPDCAEAYARQQTAALRAASEEAIAARDQEIDVLRKSEEISEAQVIALRAEVERLRLGMAHIGTCQDFANERNALVAVAKAAQKETQKVSGLHGDFIVHGGTDHRIESHCLLCEALAHPVVRRAVKEGNHA